MGEISFREKLTKRQRYANSLVCVGLDPLEDRIPGNFTNLGWIGISNWIKGIVDATAPFASMYKLQRAHYEALENGEMILRDVIQYIRQNYPDIPVFLDCKRGDIKRTQERYRFAHFELDQVDGVNFSPYMGKSCMAGLFDSKYPERALVGLCYTSNEDARDIQDQVLQDGRFIWEMIAKNIYEWAWDLGVNENAGLVMAAAHKRNDGQPGIVSDHLTRCREIVNNDLWFLIPGIGTQGGFVEETVKNAFRGPGSISINSSSGVIFAEDPAGAAETLRDQIRRAGGNC